MQSLCGEPAGRGRLAWAPDCVQTLVNDFRTSERALGVLLTYRTRRISRSGVAVSPGFPGDGALDRIVRRPNGAIEYVMRTALGDAALTLQFGHQEVAVLFQDPSGLPLSGEVFLIDSEGHFLTPPRKGSAMLPPSDGAEQLLAHCASGPNEIAGVDDRGINAI